MKKKVLTVLLAICLISGSVLVPESVVSAAGEETDGTGGENEEETGGTGEEDGEETGGAGEDGEETGGTGEEGEWGESENGEWIYITLGDGTISVEKYEGTASEVQIPSSLNGKNVTAIGFFAFGGKDTITKVTIPDGMKEIGDSAFSGCTGLKEVKIPNSVTSIGKEAFFNCWSLEDVTLPENLLSIGDSAFSGCFMESEDGIKTGLKSIAIPEKVSHIGQKAFYGCEVLGQIDVAEGNAAYSSQDGVLFNKVKTELVAYPEGKTQTKYEIPQSVQKIGNYAFDGIMNLTEITFPTSLQEIGDGAFRYMTGEGGIALPTGLKKIGAFAFENCTADYITLPASVSNIGEGAFNSYGLTEINVDAANTMYSTENGILFNKAGTELLAYPGGKEGVTYVIPSHVAEIGDSAFMEALNLKDILVPKNVVKIKGEAFGCPLLQEITIQNPQCVIEDTDNEEITRYTIWPDTKIRGYGNSLSQAYAQKNENPFEVIPDGTCSQHNYMEQMLIPSTCIKKGTTSFTCKNCGESYTEEIPLSSHNYVGTITIQASCSQKGVETFTCKNCGNSYTEEIPLETHSSQTRLQQASPGRNGSIQTKCSICGTVIENQTIAAPASVVLSKDSLTYNGNVQTVNVTVKDSAGNVIPAANYNIAFTNNKDVGEAEVTVTLLGNYTGSMKKTFRILPKSTGISRVTAKSKGFTVKWKKQALQTTGYEIQYSTSSKFKGKDTKTVNIKKNITTSKTISKLKAKKKYFIRIRTYKTVKVNEKKTNFYSGWSGVKKVTTKK